MATSPIIRTSSAPLKKRRLAPTLLNTRLKRIVQVLVALIVLWYEYGIFSFNSCEFDNSPTFPTSIRPDGQTFEGIEPFQILIVADPQILDMRSYPRRNYFLRLAGIFVTDAYARRAWNFAINSRGKAGMEGVGGGRVDAAMFLGDLMDSGVDAVDRSEHLNYVHRFHSLFPLPRSHEKKTSLSGLTPPIPLILLPGNHDLGLHLQSVALGAFARERFVESFGAVNGETIWGGWQIIWIDSMALLELGEVGDDARSFVNSLPSSTRSRILLSHIPLYRPDGSSCGSARESRRTLRQGVGKNYQNMLDKPVSDWLLASIVPRLVYSGDDHDSCIIDHPFSSPSSLVTSIRETSVKAFSMAMGVQNPGYHLLSLYPPTSSTSLPVFTQVNCTLPNQISIWLDVYLRSVIIIFSVLLAYKIILNWQSRVKRPFTTARSNGLPVHGHTKSLSRKLFGTREPIGLDDEDEAEDNDSRFPTFSNSFGDSHSSEYHSGIGNDTPTMANEKIRPQRVRRVSRVWAWEKGGFFSGSSSSDESQHRGVLSNLSPESGMLHRYLFRPLTRILRNCLRRIGCSWLATGIVGMIGMIVDRFPIESLKELLAEVFEICLGGIGLWMFLQVWFWL